MSWVSIQLGSREHYAIPKALYTAGQLEFLITDLWVSKSQSSLVRPFLPSLALRRSAFLPDSLVKHRTLGRLSIDARIKQKKLQLWNAIQYRNSWFQHWAAREVAASLSGFIFSYSYTARLPFQAAKRRGATCVLGQIDPGPREFDIVSEQSASYPHLSLPDDQPPSEYWLHWREEVAIADRIVVNSAWAANLLVEAGVPVCKLVEIPLVYESASLQRPISSSRQNGGRHHSGRLRALFLGSVILRKGVGPLFAAIKSLQNESVEFTFAGPIGVNIPSDISSLPHVRFLGSVDKQTAERLYRESDVFLFPTLSDGFGLTQLEALGHGLPVIASRNCAHVIEDGVNGLLLRDVSPEAIAEAIMVLLRDPDLLPKLQANARVPDQFDPKHLGPALLSLQAER